MVIAVRVDVKNRQVLNKINNMVFKLPKVAGDGGFEFCKLYQRNLRLQLTLNKTRWRGVLWNSIQARKRSRNQSVLVMRDYGVYLDRMKPHFVKLKRGRLIRKWALQKGNARIQSTAKREGSIMVRPHPFIDQAFTRTITRLPIIMQRRLQRLTATGG